MPGRRAHSILVARLSRSELRPESPEGRNWRAGLFRSGMQLNSRNIFASVWSRPDPVLAQAAVAGELLIAKVRVGLASLLLLIPLIDSVFFPDDPKEAIVGIILTGSTFLFSLIIYLLIARELNPPWLSFASSSLDVSLVSLGLALFVFLNEPHTAVNSKVVFEGYFLAIAGTSLRYDKRICITAGLLAVGEYLAIVVYAATHWDLNNPSYAPFAYGLFSWAAEIARLIIMATAAVLSYALVSRSQKLLKLATRDLLTGLFSRAYVDDRFAVELSRAKRYGTALSIAVIDADRFKSLNDEHGHLAGDVALRRIGALIHDSFRQSDTAGRYGGEEFVVILPETEMEAAYSKIETLRELVAGTPVAISGGEREIHITVSAGLASFPRDAVDPTELFALADERMFQAKQEGRNRVVAGCEVVPR